MRTSNHSLNNDEHDEIEAQTKAFLESGGKITSSFDDKSNIRATKESNSVRVTGIVFNLVKRCLVSSRQALLYMNGGDACVRGSSNRKVPEGYKYVKTFTSISEATQYKF